MKIAYSHYVLNGTGSFFDRKGALLQITFPDGSIGYADCHPWPELGDLPLERQLERLRSHRMTPLTACSLNFARLDAKARARGKNVFEGKIIPKSHWLMKDESVPEGFSHIKVKDPGLLLSILPSLDPTIKVRFDCNNRFTLKECCEFLEKIQPWAKQFDFIEDPIPFDRDKWDKMETKYEITLACDRDSEQYSHPTAVLKPAVQNPTALSEHKRVIVTSYLDHPLGQLAAAYTALMINSEEICGLLSHHVYQPNPWSEQLAIHDQRLVPPEGTGFGFNDLLVQQNWTELV